MRTIPIHVDAARLGAINLGKQGESLACRVRFYAPKWYEEYPDAEYQLFVTPPGEATPYLAQITAEAGTVTWDLQEADTAISGSGTLELILTDGETKIKSVTYRTTLDKSPSSQKPGSAPDVHPTWWENAIDKIKAATEEAVNSIDGAMESEKQEATAAIAKAAEDAIASIPEDYTELAGEVSSLKDAKADAITDTSARAASHELHAQRGPMSVTLFGKTTETGTGDKSPDNPYVISGLDVARVQAGGKNLFDVSWFDELSGVTISGDTLSKSVTGGNSSVAHPTEKIPVFAGMVLTISGTYSLGAGRALIRACDAKGNILQNGITGCTYNSYYDAFFSDMPATIAIGEGVAAIAVGLNWMDHGASVGTVAMYSNVQVEVGSTATAYEPHVANVINPPLLPDGAPLLEGDTVENDVLSGCDKRIVLDGSETWIKNAAGNGSRWISLVDGLPSAGGKALLPQMFSDKLPVTTTLDSWNGVFGLTAQTDYLTFMHPDLLGATAQDVADYFATNPTIVYYRSTDYTPEKDLRVCKTTRRIQVFEYDGTAKGWSIGTSGGKRYFQFRDDEKPSENLLPEKCSHFTPRQSAGHGSVYIAGPNTTMIIFFYESDSVTTLEQWCELLTKWKAEENPLTVCYRLATPVIYMTDPLPLRKPDILTTDTVTVTGSGETAVSYPHDTKHYIDSKISELVTLALANQ